MSVLDEELNFNVRDINEIIENIESSRSIVKNFFAIYKKKTYPICKDWLFDIKRWINSNQQYSFNHNMSRFEILISKSYISQILKIDSFISFFFTFKEKIEPSKIELNVFIKSFVGAFEHIDLENNNLITKFIKFSKYLINLIGVKLHNEISYDLLYNYLSLIKLFFPLLHIGKFNKQEFLQYFSIFDEFPLEYDLIEKYQILFTYYIEIENNYEEIKNLFYHFLNIHKRKEIYDKYYPDPVEFCNFFEKRFKAKPKNFVLNTYLEFYENSTTNFIPPLFLKRKSLNKPVILKIIFNNIQKEKFINRDLEHFFNYIIEIQPKKENFSLYSMTISGLKTQFFPINFYKIYNSKNLDLSEKFALVNNIVSVMPDLYSNKLHPACHKYLISKKKYLKNEKNLKSYFRLILKLENYTDFREFYLKLSLDEESLRKTFLNITEAFRKKLLKNIERILDIEEFSLLRCLNKILKKKKFNIYKLNNYESLDDYMLNELNSNSKLLKIFLFEQFIGLAEKNDDSITARKLFLEFQKFNKNIDDNDKNIYDHFYEFSNENYKENYSIEYDYFSTLIISNNKKDLNDFIIDKIKNEERRKIKNYEKLGLLYFLKGDFQNSYNSVENAISNYEKTNILIDNSMINTEKLQKLTNFKEIIRLELNLKNYGSISDFTNDLIEPLTYFENNGNKLIGYIFNFEIYKHYHNIDCFLTLIDNFEENIIDNKEYLHNLLKLIYNKSKLCIEWDDIKKLWQNKIINKFKKEELLKLAEEQYEIFNNNPIFIGLKKFLENIQKPGSNLYFLFNYDPDNLIHNFKEKYQLLNNIFSEKYQDFLFLPLNYEDLDEFNNIHIPFKNLQKDFIFFVITLSKAVSDSINVNLLKSELNISEWDKGRINLLENFIEEKLITEGDTIKKIMFGFRELNKLRSHFGVAHRKHRDYKKILDNYLLQNLSKIEISKKIISDLTVSLTCLIELIE